MYYEYWGMSKHPFNNVPDPEMYFEMHPSVENAIAEMLFAIEEGDECLAVVVGDVGVGKTMALRIVLSALDPEAYRIAFVTNPDLTFPQLLREVIGQLRGMPCETRRRESLLEEFNKLLFETADAGKRVLIFIDEANALRPVDLQSLRLLTNMQEDDRNLFTLILAGQTELARRLEHPKARNLFQRIGVYCRIEKMGAVELMRDYVEHRLELAGCARALFTDEAFDELWRYSEEGIPRLVNKICKLALKAGETNRLEQIGPEVIRVVGGRFKRKTRQGAKLVSQQDTLDAGILLAGCVEIGERGDAQEEEEEIVLLTDLEIEKGTGAQEEEEEIVLAEVPQSEGTEEYLPEESVSPVGDDPGEELGKPLSEMAFSRANPFLSIRPVNQDGSIVYRRRRYFVDPDLAGENVTVSEVDNQLFVQSGDQLLIFPMVFEESEVSPVRHGAVDWDVECR